MKVSSFTDMLNSEFCDYDEFATPTPNTNFSQSPGKEESVQATPISLEVFCSQKEKDKRQ